MEGVMMRTPHNYCVAVRKQSGEIVTQSSGLERASDKYPVLKLPVLRGLSTLAQAMALGMKALRFSAACAMDADKNQEQSKGQKIGMGVNAACSILFFIVLYKVVPLYLATKLGHAVPSIGSRFDVNILDGLFRIAIFLGFLGTLSRMKDIRRVFEYHGAEHRVVFNFESGKDVNIANAQQFVTWHPRCGTSFLMVIMVVSLIAYAFLPVDNFAWKLAARIALLPVITGVSYEIIRFAAKRQSNLLGILTRPGLWLQRVTTKSPSDNQTEVAIAALQHAMELERANGGELVIA